MTNRTSFSVDLGGLKGLVVDRTGQAVVMLGGLPGGELLDRKVVEELQLVAIDMVDVEIRCAAQEHLPARMLQKVSLKELGPSSLLS